MPSQPGSRFTTTAQDQMHQVSDWMQKTVDEQPVAAVSSAFAAGFILGSVAVAIYCAAESQSRSRDLERLSSRMMDRISRAMPKQLSDAFNR